MIVHVILFLLYQIITQFSPEIQSGQIINSEKYWMSIFGNWKEYSEAGE